jgi:excisionase family DNA binding protein
MSYTLGQAARATGKSKPTIARAIRTGKLSATRAGNGSFVIDPAELSRLYRLTGNVDGTMKQTVPGEPGGISLAELLTERDRLVAEQADTIRDLRQRLDAADARLDRLLITDQRGDNPSHDGTDLPAARWPRRMLAWLVKQHV